VTNEPTEERVLLHAVAWLEYIVESKMKDVQLGFCLISNILVRSRPIIVRALSLNARTYIAPCTTSSHVS
jgi:hypothetical protein